MPFITIILVFLFSWTRNGVSTTDAPTRPLPDHSAWTSELKKYVADTGIVDYRSWVKDQNPLDAYLNQLSASQAVSNWSINVQLSYWINVYNAYTVKLILNHYPVKSIQDIHEGKPWDHAWIKIGDKIYSLNQIENEIIRRQFKDPRIHFALNCASKSCPPLLNEAYDPARLQAQLSARTSTFITNDLYNQIYSSPIKLSKVFDWYKTDFKPDIISFLNTNTPAQINSHETIEYLEYDWGLNE